jgi:ABC-2 type transport system ATP-binding protein
MIVVRDLNKWYGSKHVLKDLNLEIKEGEIFGLLGPNGAGKTTLIRILTGQTDGKGYVRIAGIDPLKEPIKIREVVGIVPESESVPNYLTVEEYLYFIVNLRGIREEIVSDVIDKFDLSNYRKSICKELSKGTKQRLMIAAALIHSPKILFLDEPFINLDPLYQKRIREIIMDYAENGNTIFMATHIIDMAKRMCTRVGIIKEGRIISYVEDMENLEEIFMREFENA